MDELTREFLIESQEGLDRMERCLTDLEERPQDAGLIGDIFRSVHTIKGTTGFLGFKRLEKLAHAGENLLGLLREGKLAANQQVITGLLQLLDGLRGILKTIEAENAEGTGEDAALIARLEELQLPAKAEAKHAVHARAGAATPPGAHAPLAKTPAPPAPAHVVGKNEPVEAVQGLAEAETDPARPRAQATAAESSLRVDVTLLSRMMNLVGELVLTRNQVLQATSADPNMTLLSRRLDMVTADLRESVMKARMQPVSNIFSKMPRIVRDLSQGLGRRVRLQVEGQDTELDKSLLEAIKDPLTHAVRNALDHGIESPEARAAKGKPEKGTLKLNAYHESGAIAIEIIDDGAGMNREKILSKAREREIIGQTQTLTDSEIFSLIFEPGFSTADKITNISGRGVGLDVVKRNITALRGTVEVESQEGAGSTFRIRLPLTLAIIDGFLVGVGKSSYVIPLGAVEECIELSEKDRADTLKHQYINLRDQVLPFVRLREQFEVAEAGGKRENIVVVQHGGQKLGLVVDELMGEFQTVIKPLGSIFKHIKGIGGSTILGSGEVALILDVQSLVALTTAQQNRTQAVEAVRA